MTNKRNLLIGTLLFLSLAMGVIEVLLNSRGEVTSEATQSLWAVVYIILTILWAVEDSKLTHFKKSFDFDFLMYIFWPIAFPYYLISTRGMDGITLFIGFLVIWCGPWLSGLVAYVYFYNP